MAQEPSARRGRRFSRRTFLKALAGTGAAAAAGAAVDALLIEPGWIKVTRPAVRIPSLPSAWDGATVAVLTDFHRGRLIGIEHIREAVELANEARPDVIALLGDYVSRADAITEEYGKLLGKLQAPLGVFGVLGNHDYWTDAGAVESMLAGAGVRLLTNRSAILRRDGAPLCLAGVDDLWTGKPDVASALAATDPAVPRILLCHNPDYAEQIPPAPRVDVMLCGHTHGGQVKIPFGGRPRLPIQHAKYAAGWARGPHCPVYTSVGLGMVGIPVRFNCRPELAVLSLRG
ncbi:MAG TPA: metallophosphoesterase [Phycisphaerae bacterium]|nr:metallophosphoesterase [Phycisphaerae bacterium]